MHPLRCFPHPLLLCSNRAALVLILPSHCAHALAPRLFPHVICIVWETMSSSQEGLLAREAGEIVGACLAAVLQHMAFLVINTLLAWFASFFFRMKEAERKAFIIMASQKSLPTGELPTA